MSCQLSTIANIQDVLSITKYLFPEQNQVEKKTDPTDDGWNDSSDWKDSEWNWDTEEEEGDKNLDRTGSEPSARAVPGAPSWLQDSCMSLSPTGDLLVFACGERIVYLAQKWDSRDEDVQTKYSVVHEGSPIHQPGETITSVLCLPLASQKRSLEGSPDWTCVVVGFSTGYVRIYTENGTLLINQAFSEEPVVRLRCTTYAPPRSSREGERAEEICILYPKSLVLVDGFSFYQALKACKNQVARARASGYAVTDPPLLAYKKWGFTDQEASNDMAPCGYVQPSIFDQMVCDSISKGPGAGVRTSPYGSHLYLNVGRGPCINFFHTVQTSVQPQLSDVTKVVANKLKTAFLSAASGWLGFGGGGGGSGHADPKEKKPKIEPDVPLTARFGLYDKRRIGERVALSPDFKMAAVTDSFGRVVLIDATRGVAVRMWKGYRDAQVGWIESTETRVHEPADDPRGNGRRFHSGDDDEGTGRSKANEPRRTCFLVVYAPRRGILEVWSAQSGPRVAAFSVPRTGRLFYPGHGMLGLNSSSSSSSSSSSGNRFEGLFFFDVDGSVKNLSVPFHLVFSGKNCKRTRDAHLLKQLLVLLKAGRSDSASLKADIVALYRDIKTCSSQRQFLERVVTTKYLRSSTMRDVLGLALHSLPATSDDNNGIADDNEDDHKSPMAATATSTTTLTTTTTTTSNDLASWCRLKLSLLDVYDGLARLSDGGGHRCHRDEGAEEEEEGEGGRSVMEVLSDQLKLEEHEASSLSGVLERRLAAVVGPSRGPSTNRKSVAFEEKVMTPEEFLSCFQTRTKGRGGGGGGDGSEEMEVDEGEYEAALAEDLGSSEMNDLGELVFGVVVSCDLRRVRQLEPLLADGPLSCRDLTKLLVSYVLSLNLRSLAIVECLVSIVATFISRIFANKRSDDSISDFLLDDYASLCSQSENIFSALVLVLVGRHLSNQTSGRSTSYDSGWEEIHVARERWSQMTRQYQDLLAVDNLLRVVEMDRPAAALGREGSRPIGISLDRVVNEGRGIIPETIGKFIGGLFVPVHVFGPKGEPAAAAAEGGAVSDRVDPRPRGEGGISPASTPSDESRSGSSATSLAGGVTRGCPCWLEEDALIRISEGLAEVRRHLPLTASSDVVLANCCWELVAAWHRDPEVEGALGLAVEYLGRIEDRLLRRGLAKMIWEMFIVKRLSSAVLLTEKVGKSPKDRLIRKDVGLSEKSLASFVASSLDLLGVFLEEKSKESGDSSAAADEESETTPADRRNDVDEEEEEDEEGEGDARTGADVEDAWLDCCRVGRKSSLLELATNQAPAEARSVEHHRTLCLVMKAVTTFSLKPVKVFQLFDSRGRNAFFKPLSQSPCVSRDVLDDSVRAARVDFLERIIDRSVRLLGDAGPLDFERDVRPLARESGYDEWRLHIEELARLFAIGADFALVRFAYQLLVGGFDAMAIEVLPPVSDRDAAGRFLMPVLAARLSPVVLCPDAKLQARRTCISSTCLVNWIRSQDAKILRCTDVPLSWTMALAKLLTKLLDEDNPHFQLAKEAFDLIPNFEE